MEKNRIKVRINGIEYTIISNESDEYVQRVALFVDKKMSEVSELNSKLSTAMVAVLSSINIADQYLKSEVSADNLRNQVSKYIEEINKKKGIIEEHELELELLKDELQKLKIEIAKKDTKLDSLNNR